MNNEDQISTSTLSTSQSSQDSREISRQRRILIFIVAIFIFIFALILSGVYFLLQPTTPTERIRDVFIIFMALESLILGLVLVILIIQLARLINLLQNEIKPILDATNDTINNLRGTTVFLSDNLIEPVIKLNEYLAGFQQIFRIIGLARGKPKANKQGE